MQKKTKEFWQEAKAENVAMLWQGLGTVAGIIPHPKDSTSLKMCLEGQKLLQEMLGWTWSVSPPHTSCLCAVMGDNERQKLIPRDQHQSCLS